jgi:hypothetical protein
MLAVKQGRQSKEMLPNPSFERDAAEARRPSILLKL